MIQDITDFKHVDGLYFAWRCKTSEFTRRADLEQLGTWYLIQCDATSRRYDAAVVSDKFRARNKW
jgi:hypothetical protein